VRYHKAFFDLQLECARRVVAVSGMPLERAFLDYTNLYVRFGLGRDFNAENPVWRDYLAGLSGASALDDWTWRFYLARPPSAPPGVVASFGCFSYASFAHEKHGRIHLHFANVEAGAASPLSADRMCARRDELSALIAHVRRTEPGTRRVAGLSWLYNLAAYRRLFPESYLDSARVVHGKFRNMPLWGQFLDRHGALRPAAVATFRGRLAVLGTLDELSECFPLQPLAVEAPLANFA
jgi:hypothetical protein